MLPIASLLMLLSLAPAPPTTTTTTTTTDTPTGAPSFPWIVDAPEALQPHAIRIDARSPAAFKAGHVGGAHSVDWMRFRRATSPMTGGPISGALPANLNTVVSTFEALGVRGDRWVYVCGDGGDGFGEEGRLVWLLRYLGHPRAAVVRDGCQRWGTSGAGWTQAVLATPSSSSSSSSSSRTIRWGPAEPELRTSLAALASPGPRTHVVDVRSRNEFHGATPFGEVRGGHIPGAVNIPYQSFFDVDGRALRGEKARALLIAAGIDPSHTVLVYCTSGVRSAMATTLWRDADVDARNSDESFAAWAADAARSVQTDQSEATPTILPAAP